MTGERGSLPRRRKTRGGPAAQVLSSGPHKQSRLARSRARAEYIAAWPRGALRWRGLRSLLSEPITAPHKNEFWDGHMKDTKAPIKWDLWYTSRRAQQAMQPCGRIRSTCCRAGGAAAASIAARQKEGLGRPSLCPRSRGEKRQGHAPRGGQVLCRLRRKIGIVCCWRGRGGPEHRPRSSPRTAAPPPPQPRGRLQPCQSEAPPGQSCARSSRAGLFQAGAAGQPA